MVQWHSDGSHALLQSSIIRTFGRSEYVVPVDLLSPFLAFPFWGHDYLGRLTGEGGGGSLFEASGDVFWTQI